MDVTSEDEDDEEKPLFSLFREKYIIFNVKQDKKVVKYTTTHAIRVHSVESKSIACNTEKVEIHKHTTTEHTFLLSLDFFCSLKSRLDFF